jgi:hypothetical protein
VTAPDPTIITPHTIALAQRLVRDGTLTPERAIEIVEGALTDLVGEDEARRAVEQLKEVLSA